MHALSRIGRDEMCYPHPAKRRVFVVAVDGIGGLFDFSVVFKSDVTLIPADATALAEEADR